VKDEIIKFINKKDRNYLIQIQIIGVKIIIIIESKQWCIFIFLYKKIILCLE